jgi:hypothetical protein
MSGRTTRYPNASSNLIADLAISVSPQVQKQSGKSSTVGDDGSCGLDRAHDRTDRANRGIVRPGAIPMMPRINHEQGGVRCMKFDNGAHAEPRRLMRRT